MKIVVHAPGNANINLRLPSGLVLNPVSALFLPKYMRQNGLEIDRKQARLLVKAIRHYRRSHPDWVLVEVDSANGDHILITV